LLSNDLVGVACTEARRREAKFERGKAAIEMIVTEEVDGIDDIAALIASGGVLGSRLGEENSRRRIVEVVD